MSRIYFHSPSGTAEVSGAERAHAGQLCLNLTMAAMGPMQFGEPWIRRFINPNAYIFRDEDRDRRPFAEKLRLWLGYGDGADFILPDGTRTSSFDLQLNTAHVLGSDAVRLLVRLHAQCEIHCWVDGPSRAWLAGIIQQGRHEGVLRANQGWEDVIALLTSRDDEPVVTSYSVCESFPNQWVADWEPPVARDEDGTELPDEDPDYDAWYDLSSEEQWDLAMRGLKRQDEGRFHTLELRSHAIYTGSLTTCRYGPKISVFDLMAIPETRTS